MLRDLLLSAGILVLLPVCLRKPFVGLTLFTLLAYMRIQDLTWGFARYQRWSFYIAIVTLVGFMMLQGEKRFMLNDVRNAIMVGLAVIVGIGLLASGQLEGGQDVNKYVEYCKIIGIAAFTTGIVTRRDHLRILVWTIALSFGFYGFKNGLAGILSGGSVKVLEGPGGMMSDNNDFALALCMGIPMLLQIGLSERAVVFRRIMLMLVPLTMISVVLTHSRGGFLAMAMGGLVMVWRSKNRVAGLTAGLLLAIAGAFLAPKSYVDRLSTISSYEQDGSAVGRLRAWATAAEMIKAKPILGVGFGKFERNYDRYDPNRVVGQLTSGSRVAHNSYLQIWAECGTPAFLLYVSLILLSYVEVWRVRKEARKRYEASWILNYCTMFEASMTSFVVGAMFLNRAHFDLFYHLVAIIAVFGALARQEMSRPPEYGGDLGQRGTLSAVPQAGFGAHRFGRVGGGNVGFRGA